MKKTRYTGEQVAFALKQAETGTVYHYRSCRDDRVITLRIREIAETRIRYGVQRIHILLRREGWLINHKKTRRIYCQEGLNLRAKRPRRHVTARHRSVRPEVTATDQCWSMDFVADNRFNRRRIRALTVVDNFSRECLAIHVGQGLRGEDVVAVMAHLKEVKQRVPERLQTDNGSEFISKTLDHWVYENGITMAVFGMSIRTFIGSCHWKMCRKRSSSGDRNITDTDPIHR